MFLKLKLFSLANFDANSKLIGPCKCAKGDTYAKLKPLLEGIHIVGWPFQCFDVENKCKIRCKLQGLNRVSLYVYVFFHYMNQNLDPKSACMWLT